MIIINMLYVLLMAAFDIITLINNKTEMIIYFHFLELFPTYMLFEFRFLWFSSQVDFPAADSLIHLIISAMFSLVSHCFSLVPMR